VPRGAGQTDDHARDALAKQIVQESSRRDALRLGAALGGGAIAALLADRMTFPARAGPGDGIGGTTLSDTDIDAKRIAGVRIASEFADAKHAGTRTDAWPGAAIQTALADVPSPGGAVFVPAGEWSVSAPLRLNRNDVTLFGTGPASSLFVPSTNSFIDNESGMIEISGAYKGLTIEKLSLDGVSVAVTDTCRGIIIQGGSEVLVRDCVLKNWLGVLSQRGRGLTVVHNPATEAPPHKGVRVEACYFYNNQIGIVMHRTLYTIVDSYFESNVWDGMYMEGTARGVISGNLVTFSPRVGIFIIFTERNTIVGNRVEDCGSGIEVYEGRGTSIIGNHIERCSSAGVDIRPGPAPSNVGHCVISGNVIAYCSSVPGIQMLGGVTGCAVTDNVLRANRDGIAALGAVASHLSGNVCLENTRAGIYLSNSDHMRILANRAYSQPYGILAEGSTNWLMVKDNDLRGNTTAARSLVGANNLVADNWEA